MENTVSHLTDVEPPQANISPIIGVFGDAHSKPFLEAIESCSSAVLDAPAIATSSIFFAESAEKTNLSLDEVAAINLYTIECDFYRVFNQALRERDRKKLIPFFPYLRHLLIGLNKLPSYNGKLWRGVKLDLRKNYPEGKKFFWWSFSSCTVNLKVLESEQFCGKSGDRTLFCISSQRGKDIKMFSNFADEGEVLLMPGYFIVKGVMEPATGLTIIDLEELTPPFDIFIGIPRELPKPTTEIPKTTSNIPKTILKIPNTTLITPFQTKSIGVREYKFKYKFGCGERMFPLNVAIDANNNIIVSFSAGCIQVFKDGKFIQAFGSYGAGDGQLKRPQYIAVDINNNIIVADTNTNRIQVFKDGKFIQKFGSEGSADGQFLKINGVAVDANGCIIVTEENNHRIQVFKDGKFIWKFYAYDDNGKFTYPHAVAVDLNGNIVVCCCDRIQVFKDGKFIQTFGSFGSADGQITYPRSVAVDVNNNIIVADTNNNRIQVFKDGKFIQKFGSLGIRDGQLKLPHGVAVDTDGNIVVVDYLGKVHVFG